MGKLRKIGKLMDAPQEKAFNYVAEKAGVEKGKDAESTAHNLVQKAADKLGLPDSTATNVLKSMGVAGLTTFVDVPNPVSKVRKGLKGVRAINKLKKGRKTVDQLSAISDVGRAKGKGQIELLNRKVKSPAAAMAREDTASKTLKSLGGNPENARKLSPEEKLKIKNLLEKVKKDRSGQ